MTEEKSQLEGSTGETVTAGFSFPHFISKSPRPQIPGESNEFGQDLGLHCQHCHLSRTSPESACPDRQACTHTLTHSCIHTLHIFTGGTPRTSPACNHTMCVATSGLSSTPLPAQLLRSSRPPGNSPSKHTGKPAQTEPALGSRSFCLDPYRSLCAASLIEHSSPLEEGGVDFCRQGWGPGWQWGFGVARQKGQAEEARGAAGIMDSPEGWDRRSVCKVHLLLGVNDPSLLTSFPSPGPCSHKIPQSWTGRRAGSWPSQAKPSRLSLPEQSGVVGKGMGLADSPDWLTAWVSQGTQRAHEPLWASVSPCASCLFALRPLRCLPEHLGSITAV